MNSEDEQLIDRRNGITWDDVRWNEPNVKIEDYVFKTGRDLAIARAKRSAYYLQKISEFLYDAEVVEPEIAEEEEDDDDDYDYDEDEREYDEEEEDRSDEVLDPEIAALAVKADAIRRNLGI